MPVTIDERGRVTLPAELRHELGWPGGTPVEFTQDGDRLLLMPRPPLEATPGGTDERPPVDRCSASRRARFSA